MPLTFFDIERQKNWRIGLFFLVLTSLYFVIVFFLALAFLQIFSIGHLLSGSGLKPVYLLIIFVFSIIIASIHFYFSAYDTVYYIKNNIGAIEPDPEDDIHKRLMNIINEIHIATENKKNIKCVVIPSLSMNALSAVDLRGNAIIAITEGMLSRLSREQAEAVIAHEAYHILSGDCMESTVAASLFGLPASAMEKVQSISEGRVFLSPVFILAYILLKLSLLINMFVSREREYRADAGAVRMTRNPLALAEVLYMLLRNWRGTGFIGRGLEMLCIVNPQVNELDESEGFWADLMSTHPPIRKRINILLKMAHTGMPDIEKISGPVYIATGQIEGTTGFICPHCRQHLDAVSYERTHVYRCNQCGGTLAEDDKIPRVIVRGEKSCSERTKSLAKAVARENQMALTKRMFRATEREKIPLIACPKCKNPMLRRFYSLAYLVEIDHCSLCKLTWFDKDELEMLQCMIGNRIIPDTGALNGS